MHCLPSRVPRVRARGKGSLKRLRFCEIVFGFGLTFRPAAFGRNFSLPMLDRKCTSMCVLHGMVCVVACFTIAIFLRFPHLRLPFLPANKHPHIVLSKFQYLNKLGHLQQIGTYAVRIRPSRCKAPQGIDATSARPVLSLLVRCFGKRHLFQPPLKWDAVVRRIKARAIHLVCTARRKQSKRLRTEASRECNNIT